MAGCLDRYAGLPIWLTIPLATVLGGGLCTILLIPVLRLRGIYFSMVTLVLPLMLGNGSSRLQVRSGEQRVFRG